MRRADIRGVWKAFNKRFVRRVFELEDRWPPAACTGIRLSDVIRVDVGGRYETSLARVAGLTPSYLLRASW